MINKLLKALDSLELRYNSKKLRDIADGVNIPLIGLDEALATKRVVCHESRPIASLMAEKSGFSRSKLYFLTMTRGPKILEHTCLIIRDPQKLEWVLVEHNAVRGYWVTPLTDWSLNNLLKRTEEFIGGVIKIKEFDPCLIVKGDLTLNQLRNL